jgi:hypothetical protein
LNANKQLRFFAGLIIEQTGGNFNAPFLVMGSAEALGGLTFFFIKCAQKRSQAYEALEGEDEGGKKRKRYISESFS